ncbi:hypothetical protein HanRHA438_Chr08g0355041 [Helianthus annuus]|uniref:Uncharacterized protein n=1 Tax=Helianthus annuus TaxID=4232 RepID=A0A9K3NDN6_HELAN|nr:hypothetical protein HanXRQr2_Chr08g0343521 [Helianthus annuus]KAJ0539228.1 hypothetical protein HanHA300_Chr08g0283961 [Helianthus annuus]KAJ0553877.1 hypothetical protein HanHA89_Chr08g0301341 [Helianthus annuus]KAJ0722760.1 hypothetical protein HanOQP8_Chr08g0290321 [Helianthus annuus]KAJ0898278.1 hypothetical protein HanRHA438_Chr08g0355041 [Helianthus annuus]
MYEMNGVLCSSRPMRIGPAATKTGAGGRMQEDALVLSGMPRNI